MTFRTSIYALVSLAFGATALAADSFQTGLADLTIFDTDGDRHLQGYLWFPTRQEDGQVGAHGNAVWEPVKVIPGADPVPGRHPQVLLSHGMFGNAGNQAWLARALTERGYIVAAIDHPGTSTFQRDPDHQRQLWQRATDITRTIDHVIDTKEFGGLVDQNRIFMAGHSLGGFTAVLLAGGRYDVARQESFCRDRRDELVCRSLDELNVAKTASDQELVSRDWSDARIAAFAVFDLGGTHAFSTDSLAMLERPMLVIGAPVDIAGLDLDIESRALVAALPQENVTYLEPVTLSHFDFLGVCTAQALEILQEEEPDDVVVCQQGMDERRMEHDEIANEVDGFFSSH